ncbi:MAG: hypothetical protein QXK93_03125 [Candidatus Bathyarchaeia archaeon]
METALQKKSPGVVASAATQFRRLNAESVTSVAAGFLKRIGYKGSLKPKKASLEEGIYTVEVELNKFTAIIHIDTETQEIKSYEIQPKGEEASLIPASPKAIIVVVAIAMAVNIALHFIFRLLGL